MSDKIWWEIAHWADSSLICDYVFAKEVKQTTKWSVIVDGVDLVFKGDVKEIRERRGGHDASILYHVFENHILFEKNDSETWKRIEQYLPGVICDREINTDDVIDRGCVRFKSGLVLVEYNPRPKDGFEFKWVSRYDSFSVGIS